MLYMLSRGDPLRYAQLRELPRDVLIDYLELADIASRTRTLEEQMAEARAKREGDT